MKFNFEQRWNAAADRVMAVDTDQAVREGLSGLSATSAPEVLGVDTRGSTTVVRLHYRLAVDLPTEAARFIDTSNVSWIQETTWNLDDRSARVAFLPDQAGRLIGASATTRLLDHDGGAVRKVSGEIKVRIPLLGSRVERAIVAGVGDHLAEETAQVQDRLG
ncbi:MAG: DUF2505 family protein [Microthrixaceae bacterium]